MKCWREVTPMRRFEGLVVRRQSLAERRKVVGLSQERLAEAVAVDRTTIARWERGECDPLPWHRPALAKALNLSVEKLAELLSDKPATVLAPGEPTTVDGSVFGYDAEEEDVRRRTFLKAFAAAGTSGALAATGIESLRHELVTAIGGEPADLADWEAITWEYGRTFAVTPPPVLLEDLALDLLLARERLRGLRDMSSRADLLRVIARLAVLMAHTLGNLGNARASFRWWRVAQGSATEAADNEVRMWVAG